MSDGPWAKTERAKRHIREVEALLGEFIATNPYEVRIDKDSEPGKALHKVARVEAPPIAIALAAGDAIHNLRSALDHIYCLLVVAAKNTPTSNDMFLIRKSAKSFKTEALPKIKTRVSNDAAEVIRRLKPYQAGNRALWRLHRLDIADKHRALYIVGSAFRSMRIPFPPLKLPGGDEISIAETFPDLFIRPADRMFPLKEGDVLFIDNFPSESKDEPQFRLDVAFREPEVIEGEPILETLNDLVSATEQTIELFRPLL